MGMWGPGLRSSSQVTPILAHPSLRPSGPCPHRTNQVLAFRGGAQPVGGSALCTCVCCEWVWLGCVAGDECEVSLGLRAACVFVSYKHALKLAGVRVPPVLCLFCHKWPLMLKTTRALGPLCANFTPRPHDNPLQDPIPPWLCSGPTVAMSMEAVASSMMKMLVFLTKARARQNSCLWP